MGRKVLNLKTKSAITIALVLITALGMQGCSSRESSLDNGSTNEGQEVESDLYPFEEEFESENEVVEPDNEALALESDLADIALCKDMKKLDGDHTTLESILVGLDEIIEIRSSSSLANPKMSNQFKKFSTALSDHLYGSGTLEAARIEFTKAAVACLKIGYPIGSE
jgi:hypothetical protein